MCFFPPYGVDSNAKGKLVNGNINISFLQVLLLTYMIVQRWFILLTLLYLYVFNINKQRFFYSHLLYESKVSF